MALPRDFAAMEQRTYGVFTLMLGAGLVLDSGPRWLAIVLMLIGIVLFGRGVLKPRAAVEPQTLSVVDATAKNDPALIYTEPRP